MSKQNKKNELSTSNYEKEKDEKRKCYC